VPDETVTGPEQREINRLQKLSGAEFDKAYIHHMVHDDKKDVKDFQSKADDAKDPDIKTFATTTLRFSRTLENGRGPRCGGESREEWNVIRRFNS